MFTVQINQVKLQMEVDNGASASIISYDTFALLWSKSQRPQLRPSNRKLHTYTAKGLVVKEQLTVENVYGDQQKKLPLLVVASNGPSLMGRDWLRQIRQDWKSKHSLTAASSSNLQMILDNHAAVFAEDLGCVKGVKAKIYVDPEARTRFCKAQTVSFALRAKVNKELE